MKSTFRILSILFVLIFSAACFAHAETDPSEAEFAKMLENGMTLLDIAVMAEADPALQAGLSEMGTTTLSVMHLVLERELLRRNPLDKEVIVPIGEYIVGEDIPAGTYTLTAYDNLTDIEVYSNSKCVHNHCLTSAEKIGKLPLQDGQVVKIKYGSMVFAPYKGLGF